MGRKVKICSDVKNGISRYVEAYIEDGCLRIAGQDLGAGVPGGDGEYEYFFSFNSKETMKLADIIADGSMELLLGRFAGRFRGSHWYFKFIEFCKENNLQYTYFSC